MRHGWWVIIAAVIAAASCGTSGGGKSGPGQDGGTGGDAGTIGDAGTDGGGQVADGGTDGGVPPDAGLPDGGGGGSTTLDWSRLADRPLGTSEAHGEMVGGKLYTFGGFNWATACCTPWRFAFVYDPATDEWSPLADMPEGVTHAGTTTDGTDVYYAGGFIEDASRTYQIFGTKHVWRYRVATGTYEALPELPVERGGGALQYLDGKLHFFGGLSFGQVSDTPEHWVLDLAGGGTSWVAAAPMPSGRARNHLGAVVLGGKMYAVGGQHGHDEGLVTTPYLDVYDPATNTWTELPDMPVAKSHISAATFVLQARILTVAGETANGVWTTEIAAYDPARNAWEELTPFPEKIYSGIARPMLGGIVYTTGGYSQRTWLGVPAN